MKSYIIHNLQPCEDHKGNKYPQRWGVSLKDKLGRNWDGGEYLTRQEAVDAGKSMTA